MTAFDRRVISREAFEERYRENPDPWNYHASAYERGKYQVTIDSLSRERFATAFEPACSVGELTAMLASRCNRLLATDVSESALGPAACWAGGAAGLLDGARSLNKRDPHALAQLGAIEAAEWGLRAVLAQAAREIDADPHDTSDEARRRALMARHLIERLCTDVLDRFGRATGPQLLAFDAQMAQRHAELYLYIRQCHAERDLAAIPR
jgi:hypothetical protein